MKTSTYNDEAAPWGRSDDLVGIRLVPSSNDSNNNFSGTLLQNTQDELMVNQNTPMTGTIYIYRLSLALILCLFKAKTCVCILKMDEDG
jgi:hypothetical protein